jgi:hypothetical protein
MTAIFRPVHFSFYFLPLLWSSAKSFAPALLAVTSSHTKNHVNLLATERQTTQPKIPVALHLLSTHDYIDKYVNDATNMTGEEVPKTIGKIVFLLSAYASEESSQFGSSSPVDTPSFLEAAQQIAEKTYYYADGLIDYDVMMIADDGKSSSQRLQLLDADMVIAMGLRTESDLTIARELFEERREHARNNNNNQRQWCHFAVDCAQELPALVGPYDLIKPSIRSQIVPWSTDATGRRMHDQMRDLFQRYTSDDFCYALVLFLNQFSGHPIDWVRYRTDASWEKGPVQNVKEFYAMIRECGDCITPCIRDPQCRECLGKLARIDPRDQATSYRTLVSYESDLLTKFSLCVFTKKNIFQCDAKIPTLPKVQPMTTWRGKALTEADARALLVAHLDDPAAPEGGLNLDVSWMVACGANVAYDQFSSQHQIFYPAARGKDMWYDPFFRVNTLDDRNIWCKRHYKVRPASMPGTFRFSVSDNGVTSDEFWTIVAAADDLSWIVFHYAGAAKAVGLRYLGGLLCTPNGSLPEESQLPQIWDSFRSAGIQPWELYVVDNRKDTPASIDAGPPPLDYYRAETLKRRLIEAAS